LTQRWIETNIQRATGGGH